MNKSIYESIKKATVDGQLPDDYSLSDLTDGEGDVSFADGALDGITMYHMPPFEMTESDYQVMTEAINAANNHEFEIADSLFIQLSKENRAVSLVLSFISYAFISTTGKSWGYGAITVLTIIYMVLFATSMLLTVAFSKVIN